MPSDCARGGEDRLGRERECCQLKAPWHVEVASAKGKASAKAS